MWNRDAAIEHIRKEIHLTLEDDHLYWGWLKQIASDTAPEYAEDAFLIQEVIKPMVVSGEIVIGELGEVVSPYTKFIAWAGDLESQVERMVSRLRSAPDRFEYDVAVWFTRPDQVDEVEGGEKLEATDLGKMRKKIPKGDIVQIRAKSKLGGAFLDFLKPNGRTGKYRVG